MTDAGKHPRFRTLDSEGLNGGMPAEDLAGTLVTPPAMLFTRSHAASPRIDGARWRIAVRGLVSEPASFTVADLEARFPPRQVIATMICAGLRRQEFLRLGPLPGELPWTGEPVGTSRWQGVSLRDLLETVGVLPEARHVGFTGGDLVERHGERFGFGGSIPLHKARDPDVLLATRLDGDPIPAAHGFPVRVVVPGWVGARSVKWLQEIELRAEPSDNYFQTRAYRVQRIANPEDPRDVTDGVPLEEVLPNAMILVPPDGASLPAGRVEIKGWAIGPHGTAPSRVELSPDGGTTWQEASMRPTEERWTWRLWSAQVHLGPGDHELVVRAWDQEGRGQPASVEETWNVKGYANNAWHRARVTVRE